MAEATEPQLLEWFVKNGGFINPDVSLRKTAEYGYHFTASKDLPINTTPCSCPFNLTISHLNLLPSPPAGIKSYANESLCSTLVGKLSKSAVGSFFLAEQRLKGVESFWAPYINALPKNDELTTPLWFTPEDLKWLEGTNLYSSTGPRSRTAVELRRTMYKDEWKSGIATLKEAGVNTDPFTWELCLWAATIFSSRCFTSTIMTKSKDESFPLLYPVIDYFNHRFGAKVVWNMEKGDFFLTLEEPVKSGEQIFNNYAPKGNEELLMGYGFCIPNNTCDQVAIRIAKQHAALHQELKRCMPMHFKSESWSDEESVFYIRGSNHYTGGYTNSLNMPCLRGLPQSFVFTLHKIIAASWESQQEDLDNELAVQSELWYDTICILLERLVEKQNAVTEFNKDLPVSPQNDRQRHAKAYRDGQLAILQEVIGEITAFTYPINRTVWREKAFPFLLDPASP